MEYTKQNFENGKVLTAEQLNRMEDGIAEAAAQVEAIGSNYTPKPLVLDLTRYGDLTTGTMIPDVTLKATIDDAINNGRTIQIKGDIAIDVDGEKNSFGGMCATVTGYQYFDGNVALSCMAAIPLTNLGVYASIALTLIASEEIAMTFVVSNVLGQIS